MESMCTARWLVSVWANRLSGALIREENKSVTATELSNQESIQTLGEKEIFKYL